MNFRNRLRADHSPGVGNGLVMTMERTFRDCGPATISACNSYSTRVIEYIIKDVMSDWPGVDAAGECRRVSVWENGAGCRSRTRDLLITNQLLYQLS